MTTYHKKCKKIMARLGAVRIPGYVFVYNVGTTGEFRRSLAPHHFIGISIFPRAGYRGYLTIVMRIHNEDNREGWKSQDYIIERGVRSLDAAIRRACVIARTFTKELEPYVKPRRIQ